MGQLTEQFYKIAHDNQCTNEDLLKMSCLFLAGIYKSYVKNPTHSEALRKSLREEIEIAIKISLDAVEGKT